METSANLWGDMARPATYEDIEALPENQVGQIVDGELIALPRPSGEHGFAASRLTQLLSPFDLGPIGGWWLIGEPELHLAADVLVPDLAGWRREPLPSPTGKYFELPPDWLCEILSPSTARLDRISKMRSYAANGVEFIWLVDPAARTLEAYRREGSGWNRLGAWEQNETVRAAPFTDLELQLRHLWAPSP